jgi:hypothetical protein
MAFALGFPDQVTFIAWFPFAMPNLCLRKPMLYPLSYGGILRTFYRRLPLGERFTCADFGGHLCSPWGRQSPARSD